MNDWLDLAQKLAIPVGIILGFAMAWFYTTFISKDFK